MTKDILLLIATILDHLDKDGNSSVEIKALRELIEELE